jgi:DnaA family protein
VRDKISLLKQLLLDFTRPPAPTFTNFIPGRNAEAAHAVEAAARGEYPERVFYIWGEPGAGKTHLLRAFAQASGARCLAAADYDPAMRDPILVLDGLEGLSQTQQAGLFNAFNERAQAFLLVSAGAAPRDVNVRRDLATRLATGITYRLAPLSDEEKREALGAHARVRGFDLSDEVAGYLLTHARRDMGSLISALDTLDRYSLETGRAVTVPLLKAAMQ